jgi:competence protein ComEA
MIWLYRLQQRLSITRHEALAVVTLTLLFLTGLTVRHIKNQQVPPLSPDTLVALDSSGAAGPSAPATDSSPSPDAPLNVNAASPSALEALPGIGPTFAKRITQYRSTQRPFQRVKELKRIRGIGPKTLADLRPLVHIGPTDSTATSVRHD